MTNIVTVPKIKRYSADSSWLDINAILIITCWFRSFFQFITDCDRIVILPHFKPKCPIVDLCKITFLSRNLQSA